MLDMLAQKALNLFIEKCRSNNISRILDIGAGDQSHTRLMREAKLNVETSDFSADNRPENFVPDYSGNYLSLTDIGTFDGIWCSHVLEHQRNPGIFLDKVHRDLEEGGILSITVPPRKDSIVGGHVTLWNAGLLLYNLILSGFDCSDASVSTYGYNCSVVLKKRGIDLPSLCYCRHDIDKLAKYFPKGLAIEQGFDGVIEVHNWKV